jgi:hypothetical protein
MPSDTLLADHTLVGIHQHVIRADELVIVGREYDFTVLTRIFLPLFNLENDRWSKLIIEIIEMAYIRLKIIKHETYLFTGFRAVNSFYRVSQL